jgi:hypothetical protein
MLWVMLGIALALVATAAFGLAGGFGSGDFGRERTNAIDVRPDHIAIRPLSR